MSFRCLPRGDRFREIAQAGGMYPTRPQGSSPPRRRVLTTRRLQILPARLLQIVLIARRLLVLGARRLELIAGRRRVRGGRREHRGERDRNCGHSLHVSVSFTFLDVVRRSRGAGRTQNQEQRPCQARIRGFRGVRAVGTTDARSSAERRVHDGTRRRCVLCRGGGSGGRGGGGGGAENGGSVNQAFMWPSMKRLAVSTRGSDPPVPRICPLSLLNRERDRRSREVHQPS